MKKTVFVAISVLASATLLAEGRFSPFGLSFTHGERRGEAQFPSSDDGVYGWRLAIVNGAHRDMVGLATAVLANDDAYANGYVGGLQVASIFNTAGKGELGIWQVAGVYNSVDDTANGFQVCAFYNELKQGYFNGLQIALCNKASVDFCGMQIGLYNDCDVASGMQIGVYNQAKTLAGIQIGLLNCVTDSQLIVFPVLRIGW